MPRPICSDTTDDQPSLRVAVLVEFDDTWGRNVVEAIARFSSLSGWQLLLAPRDAQRRLRIPDGWEGDGAIAMLRDESLVDHLKETRLPTVNVSGQFLEEGWAGQVATDDTWRARLAFDHFSSRRLVHFAYYGPPNSRYSDGRGEAFQRFVSEQGFPCEMLEFQESPRGSYSYGDRQELAERLRSLPKPTGILAADPYPARQLIECCLACGIDIPGDVLVLSGDEDELLCNLVQPPITSIELASHRIGWEACEMLVRMHASGETPIEAQLVKPLRVRPRRSTDHTEMGDPLLESVLDYIKQNAANPIRIQDLARFAAISRRTLELRFRDALGRSPAEEIRRVRLEQARQMLLNTSLSVSSIAAACGLSSGPYLTHAFRKAYGVVPSDLRIGRSSS